MHLYASVIAASMIEISTFWKKTDDTHITCVFCGKNNCTHEWTSRRDDHNGQRRTVTVGVHDECATNGVYLLGNDRVVPERMAR